MEQGTLLPSFRSLKQTPFSTTKRLLCCRLDASYKLTGLSSGTYSHTLHRSRHHDLHSDHDNLCTYSRIQNCHIYGNPIKASITGITVTSISSIPRAKIISISIHHPVFI